MRVSYGCIGASILSVADRLCCNSSPGQRWVERHLDVRLDRRLLLLRSHCDGIGEMWVEEEGGLVVCGST